jgi:hypothetical protein
LELEKFHPSKENFILLPPKVEPTTTPMESDGVEAKDSLEICQIERRRMDHSITPPRHGQQLLHSHWPTDTLSTLFSQSRNFSAFFGLFII